MKPINAFILKGTKESIVQAKKCLDAYQLLYSLWSVQQHQINEILKDNDIVVSFGSFVSTMIDRIEGEKRLSIKHIRLPSTNKLINSSENQQSRADTAEQLQTLKKEVEELEKTISLVKKYEEKDLPNFNKVHLEFLEKQVKESNTNSFSVRTKSGETLKIWVKEPEKDNEGILVADLYTIMLIKEIVKFEDITIEKREKK